MTGKLILIIIPAVVTLLLIALIVGLIIFMRINRKGNKVISPTKLSHIVCPKCGLEFDYAWIPGASFTDVRLFNSRLFNCPGCGNCSKFNVYDTTVDPETHHCKVRVGPS